MTTGRLAMVICPILEDEMIYSILNDREEKDVYLLENDNNKTLLPKLAINKIKYTSIPEDDFFSDKITIPKDRFSIIIWMMDIGLHSEPECLKQTIRQELLRLEGRADAIALYYGLCGNGLTGIIDWIHENMTIPATIFTDKNGRVCDDCVCVPLGGPENYLKLLRRYPGVMYLTPAMACSQEEFMGKQELFKGLDQVDMSREEFMRFMLDMAGYKYALKIDDGIGDREHFDEECEKYAKKYNLELKELEPEWISLELADKIYAEGKSFLK